MINVPISKITAVIAAVIGFAISAWAFYSYFTYKDAEIGNLVKVDGIVEYCGELSNGGSVEIRIENNSDKYLINSYAIPVFDMESFIAYAEEGNVVHMLTAPKGQKFKRIYEIKSTEGITYLNFQDVVLKEQDNAKWGLYVGIIFISITIGLIILLRVISSHRTLLSKDALEHFVSSLGFKDDYYGNGLIGNYRGYGVIYSDNVDYFDPNKCNFAFIIAIGGVTDEDDMITLMDTLELNLFENKWLKGYVDYFYDDFLCVVQRFNIVENEKELEIPKVIASLKGVLKKDIVFELLDALIDELVRNKIAPLPLTDDEPDNTEE